MGLSFREQQPQWVDDDDNGDDDDDEATQPRRHARSHSQRQSAGVRDISPEIPIEHSRSRSQQEPNTKGMTKYLFIVALTNGWIHSRR